MNNWYDYFKVFDLPQASNWAGKVDNLYDFIFWLTVVGFLGVVIPAGLVVYYLIWKYLVSYFNRLLGLA